MCSINGCVDFIHPERVSSKAAEAACFQMRRRGPDGSGHFDAPGVSLWHNRLAVMDPAGGKQPMRAVFKGQRYTVVYNGEIYNTAELRRTLTEKGAVFFTACDTEVVLWSYIMFDKIPQPLVFTGGMVIIAGLALYLMGSSGLLKRKPSAR